jgi:hypothetical protein
MKIDFKDKSDDELIRIMEDQTSSNITNTMRTAAKIELHKRQSNIDKSTNVLTRWIFFLTLFIAILTCILLLLQWCSSSAQPIESVGIQHLTDSHDTTKDNKAKGLKMALISIRPPANNSLQPTLNSAAEFARYAKK